MASHVTALLLAVWMTTATGVIAATDSRRGDVEARNTLAATMFNMVAARQAAPQPGFMTTDPRRPVAGVGERQIIKDNKEAAELAESVRMMGERAGLADYQSLERRLQQGDVRAQTASRSLHLNEGAQRTRRGISWFHRKPKKPAPYVVYSADGQNVMRRNFDSYTDAKQDADTAGATAAIVTKKSQGLRYVNPSGYYNADYRVIKMILRRGYRSLDEVLQYVPSRLRTLVREARLEGQF